MNSITDLAQQKFGNDWHRAIVCAWPAWRYIRGIDSMGEPFYFCQTWYAELRDRGFAELLAIAGMDARRRDLEFVI